MYLYIFKNRRFIDRLFINSSEVDDAKKETEEWYGEDTDVVTTDEFIDSPTYEELCISTS